MHNNVSRVRKGLSANIIVGSNVPRVLRKKTNFFQIALKRNLEGIFRCDFFKTASTHRDTSIAHVFHDFGPPVTPIPPYRTPGNSKISKDFCIFPL